jgi:hypothetical protein
MEINNQKIKTETKKSEDKDRRKLEDKKVHHGNVIGTKLFCTVFHCTMKLTVLLSDKFGLIPKGFPVIYGTPVN